MNVTPQPKQNSFISGLITKQALERSDLAEFHHGLAQADNVVIRAHGGVSRRDGLQFVDVVPMVPQEVTTGFTITTPNGGDYAKLTNGVYTDYFKTTNAIGTTDGYVAFFVQFSSPTHVDFFDLIYTKLSDGSNVSPLGTSEFFVQVSSDGFEWSDVRSLYLTNNTDDSYRAYVNATVSYVRVIRVGSTDLGSNVFWAGGIRIYSSVGSSAQPVTRLQGLVRGDGDNYMLLFFNYGINVYQDGNYIASIPTPTIQPSQIPEIKFSALSDSLVITHKDIAPLIVQRFTDAGDIWRVFPMQFSNIPYYDSSMVRFTLSGSCSVADNSGVITVTSSQSDFLSSDVGCMLYGNGGSCRIISYESATKVQVIVVNSFSFYNARSGWTLERNSAPLWGEEYGYPSASCFFANRLWFGGFKRAPNVLACSVIGDYFNFDEGSNDDDDAVVVALLSGSERHAIRFLYSFDNLEIYTSGGMFSLKKYDTGTITKVASGIYYRKSISIDPYIAPFRVEDGGTLIVKEGRSDIREITYDDITYTYNAKSRSLLCLDAIYGVSSVAVLSSQDVLVADQVLMVNGENNLASLTYLLSEEVHGASVFKTDGNFITVGSAFNQAYVVVNRDGNLLLERFGKSFWLDSEVLFPSCTGGVLTGLEHLVGKTVQVRADNEYLGEFTVSEVGSVTIPQGDWQEVHVGLEFDCVFSPVSPELEQGSISGKMKNFSFATVSCYDTQNITLDGYDLEFLGRTFNAYNFTPLEYYSGRFRVRLGGDPSLTPVLVFRQDKPLEFNVRSVTFELEVGS